MLENIYPFKFPFFNFFNPSSFFLYHQNSLKSWLGLTQPTKPACEVRIAPTYKHIVRPCPVRCGTLNTHPHDQHYWAWFVDINGGWPDSGNLIADDPMDLGEALIPS